jgi:hypothetical protein
MRLFVDCDDTLVLWLNDGKPTSGPLVPEGPHPYGAGADRWLPNEALLVAVRAHMASSPDDHLIIWTGGGEAYARTWAGRLFPQGDYYAAISKDTRLPLPGDLCVDDMPMKVACDLVTWQEFVARSGDGVAKRE